MPHTSPSGSICDVAVGPPQEQNHRSSSLIVASIGNAPPPIQPPDSTRLVVESDRDSMMNASATSLDPVLPDDKIDEGNQNQPIKLSGKRWFVLLAIAIFGFSNSISNDTSPILSLILQLLDLQIDHYVYITQIFYYFMALTAVPSAWFVDKYGIKRAIQAATGLFAFNCIVKALLYSPILAGWQQFKMLYYIISSTLGTQVTSLFFLLPLKVSETWFSASERSVAWTVMISQMDLGTCVASFVYPRIMQTLDEIEIFAYINIVAALTTALICLVCVTSAAPEHPPSERMAKASKGKELPLLESVKRVLKQKDVMLHLVHLATFESCTLSIASVLQSILVSAGHSKIFAGNFMSINALVSIIMLIAVSSLVHKVTNITFACKLSSVVQVILFIIYVATLLLHAPGYIVVGISIILTISKSWATPNMINMTAHLSCGLVQQATIVGFTTTLTIIIITVIQLTFVSLMEVHRKTTNYSHSLIFLGIVCFLNEIIYQLLFQGKRSNKQTTETENNDNQDIENTS